MEVKPFPGGRFCFALLHQVCCSCCPVPPSQRPTQANALAIALLLSVTETTDAGSTRRKKAHWTTGWNGLKTAIKSWICAHCFVVSILVVCPTGIHRISTCQWILWRNCLGYSYSDADRIIHTFDCPSRQCSIEEGWDEKQGDEERVQERMRGQGCKGKAGRGEVRAKDPWIHLNRSVIQRTPNFGSKCFFLLKIALPCCSPKTWSFWFCEFSRRASQKAQSRAIPIMTNWWWVPNISLIFSHFLWSHAMEQKDSCICLDIFVR